MTTNITNRSLGKRPLEVIPAYKHGFTDLPKDMVQGILINLNLKDIVSCSLLSKGIHQITSDVNLWRYLYYRHFRMDPPEQNFSIKTYEDFHRYHSNVAKGVYASNFLISEEKDDWDAGDLITITDGKLFLFSWRANHEGVHLNKYSLKAWDLKAMKPLGIIAEFETPFSRLVGADKKLFGLSINHQLITIIDLENKNCLDTINLKMKPSSLTVANEKIFLGTPNNKIKIYDLKTKSLLKTLEGHENKVSWLAVAGEKLFSCDYDSTIMVWDLKTGDYTKICESETADASHFALTDTGHLICSGDETTEVWDLEKGVCSLTMHIDELGYYRFVTAEGKIFFPDYTPPCSSGQFGIRSFNFKAKDDKIFKEIAFRLKNNQYNIKETIERFLRMPKTARNEIYEELCLINNEYELNSTPEEIGQEIENYMDLTISDYYSFKGKSLSPKERGFLMWNGARLSQAIEHYLNKRK